jgi:hypothetical protein
MMRLAFKEPPAIVGFGRIGEEIDLPVDRTDHPLFLHQAHGRRRKRIAHAQKISDRIQPVSLFQPVPIGQSGLALTQHQPFVRIVHIMGEKLWRAAACLPVFGDWRKLGARQAFKIDVTFAARHEHKGATETNLVANRNLALHKSAIAAAPQYL